MIRAVLFDAAGTLIEPAEAIGESYARIARAHGVALPAARLEDAFRRVHAARPPMVFPDEPAAAVARHERTWWRESVRQTFRAADSSVRVPDLDGCFDALFRHFAEPASWRVRRGARSALAALREGGCATGVVSNFDQRLHGILAGLGLRALLDVVVLPAEAGAAKPAPRIFELALEHLDVAAHQTAFVGDDPARDLAAARALGMRAIDAGASATLAELPRLLAAEAPEPA